MKLPTCRETAEVFKQTAFSEESGETLFNWSFSCLPLSLGICMLSKNVNTLYGNIQGLEKHLKIKRAGDLSVSRSYHPLSTFQWCNWYLRRRCNEWAEIGWLWGIRWMLNCFSQLGNVPEHFWSGLLFWLQEHFTCIDLMLSTKPAASRLFCIIGNCVHKLLFSERSEFGLYFYHF